METFFEWLDNKNLWIDLYMSLFRMHSKGIYENQYENHHNELVKKLRTLALGEDANELEMVKLSQEDIEYGAKPTNSGEINHNQRKQNYRAGYNAYLDHIESIIKKVNDHILKMGWEEDLRIELKKVEPSFVDYDYYSDFTK